MNLGSTTLLLEDIEPKGLKNFALYPLNALNDACGAILVVGYRIAIENVFTYLLFIKNDG